MPDILTYLKEQGIPTDDLYASLGLDDLDRWQLALLIEEQSGGEITMDSIPYEAWDTTGRCSCDCREAAEGCGMRWPALLLRKTVAEYLDMSEAAVDALALSLMVEWG